MAVYDTANELLLIKDILLQMASMPLQASWR